MIGQRVVWKHLRDGKPVLPFAGEVVSVQLSGSTFRILCLTDAGELMSQDAADLRVVEEGEEACSGINHDPDLGPVSGFRAAELEGMLDLVDLSIKESGFEEAAMEACEGGTNDVQSRARWLILTLSQELKDMGAQHEADEEKIKTLIRERDEAKSKKKPKAEVPQ